MKTSPIQFQLPAFDEPFSPGTLLSRPSFVRIAASAYRPSKVTISWADVERLRVADGEVTYVREGKNFRLCRVDDLETMADLDHLLGTHISIYDRRRAAKKGGA